jgi:two-component system CitB family response regulator
VIRTLVVDDDYRVADVHCAYVKRIPGFSVVGKVHTGIEALSEVKERRPDLVLLDLYLPDISGLEVLRRLHEGEGEAVDVIAITAANDVASLRSAIKGGVLHYLIKPFRLTAFEEKLTSYAAARARLQRISQADQREVNRIFNMLHVNRDERLPKGLSESTLDAVVYALRRATAGLPAAAVAQIAGLSRVTARRYLDHLCQTGAAELTLRYGAPGRPEHRYRLTQPQAVR